MVITLDAIKKYNEESIWHQERLSVTIDNMLQEIYSDPEPTTGEFLTRIIGRHHDSTLVPSMRPS